MPTTKHWYSAGIRLTMSAIPTAKHWYSAGIRLAMAALPTTKTLVFCWYPQPCQLYHPQNTGILLGAAGGKQVKS